MVSCAGSQGSFRQRLPEVHNRIGGTVRIAGRTCCQGFNLTRQVDQSACQVVQRNQHPLPANGYGTDIRWR